MTVGQLEGIIVKVPTNQTCHLLVSGLFSTNTFQKYIPSGQSIVASPLYQLLNTTNFQVDLFTTSLVGGYSQLPMANGYSPRCTLHFMTNSAGDYFTYNLTNTVWYACGYPTTVPIHLTEGFWVNEPTNLTWNVNMPIW